MDSASQSAYSAGQANTGSRANTEKTEKTGTPRYTLNPEKIPQELRNLGQWVVWRAEPRKGTPGKFDKKPVAPHPLKGGMIPAGVTISHKDPDSWLTFDQASTFWASPPPGVRVSGIGLSLTSDLGVSVIDLDDCFDEQHKLKAHHQDIVDTLRSYTEVSPSGKGLHIFMRGLAPGRANNREHGVEIYPYPSAQFITLTGNVWGDRSEMNPEPQDEALAALFAQYGGRTSAEPSHVPPMPVIDHDNVRSLEKLVEDGVLDGDCVALLTSIEPGDTDTLIERYAGGEHGGVDRSKALFGLAARMALHGATAEEIFAHLSNRDHLLVQCIDEGRSGDPWLWRYVIVPHLATSKANSTEAILAMFEPVAAANSDDGPEMEPAADGAPTSRKAYDIFSALPEHDWGDRFKNFTGDYFEAIEPRGTDGERPAQAEQPVAYPPPPVAGFTFRDACHDTKPEIELLEDLLGIRGSSVVYSGTNVGKSAFMLDLAVHVASGREWRGKRVEKGPVLYIAAESPESIRARISAIQRHDRKLSDDLPIFVVKERVKITSEMDRVGFLRSVFELCKWMQEVFGTPPVLTILDTFTKAAPGADENSNTAMGELISFIHDCAEKSEGRLPPMHWSVIHHTGKDQSKGHRGAQIILDQPDTEIRLTRNEVTKQVTAVVNKQRKLPSNGYEAYYQVKGVPIGKKNNFDNEATAPIVVHDLVPLSSDTGAGDKRIPVLREMLEHPISAIRKIAEEIASKGIRKLGKTVVADLAREMRDQGLISGTGKAEEPWVVTAEGNNLLLRHEQ